MRWRYLAVQCNPMSLIELHGSSKRTRKIVFVIRGAIPEAAASASAALRVMVTLAMCLELRVSEILGLRWEDVDLDEATLQVTTKYGRNSMLNVTHSANAQTWKW